MREMQAGRAGRHVKATMLNQIKNPNLFWEALDLLLGAHGNFSIANTSQSLNQMSVLLEDSKPLMCLTWVSEKFGWYGDVWHQFSNKHSTEWCG